MDPLLAETRGAVRVLTLNRPDRLNALNDAVFARLHAEIAAAEADAACRAVLLQGAGRGFCAGQDLTEAPSGDDLGGALERNYNPLVRRMRALPKPVVCAVQGVAAGAGANLALACDLVLAGRDAVFVQAFVRIGLIPDAGGTWLLPRLVGDARARGLAMLGEPLTGAQAAEWGLIWRAVDDDALPGEAMALAERLAAGPTRALGLLKRALDVAGGQGLDAQLDLERDLQRQAGGTADFAEGVRAFLEKRPARFTGTG